VQLKRASTPARPAFDPEGGGGRAELGEWCRIYTGALRPLGLVGGGVVLGRACLTQHATLAPRQGDGRWWRAGCDRSLRILTGY
jgi:hypothetical protein